MIDVLLFPNIISDKIKIMCHGSINTSDMHIVYLLQYRNSHFMDVNIASIVLEHLYSVL